MNWRIFAPVIALVVVGLLWEALVWVNDWPNYKMASPSDLGPAFWKFRWLFLEYGWDTLWRTVAGLILSVFAGLLLGMIMGLNRTMRDALYPLLVGFNAIPKATVVPIIALLFVGRHDMNTILIAFLISFFPIAVSVSIGLSTLEPEYRDILAALGASRFTIFWKIRASEDAPGVLRGAQGRGNACLHRHESDGDRGTAWTWTWPSIRQRQDQRELSPDVCRAHCARGPWHCALLRCRGAGAHLRWLG